MPAEGKPVREISVATGHKDSTVRWHWLYKFSKNGISRQVELIQLVLSFAGIGWRGRGARRRSTLLAGAGGIPGPLRGAESARPLCSHPQYLMGA